MAGLVGTTVVVVGGCAALLGRATLPHGDAANDFLDAVRALDVVAAESVSCDEIEGGRWLRLLGLVAGSASQDLTSIQVTNGFGEVSGRVDFVDPAVTDRPITVRTASRPDGVCVLSP